MRFRIWYLLPFVLIGAVALGPKPDYPAYDARLPQIDMPLAALEQYIKDKESKVSNLKPDNEARIVWFDSVRQTDYCVVYLHGFSASPMEGDPVHFEFAKRYGCNLYLPRLTDHGIDDRETFSNLTPKSLVESAKEAIAIGQLLGKEVIVMGTSTGCTLGIYLASENQEAISSLILYSPNLELYDKTADIITWPWGAELAHVIAGDYHLSDVPEFAQNYWTPEYRVEGIIALKYLMEETMQENVYKKITQPYFVGYYYKNEEEMDDVIDINAIPPFIEATSTPDSLKMVAIFPDVGRHELASKLRSQDIDDVLEKTYRFAEQVLNLKPKEELTFLGK